jgi:hypothetical protein
VAKRGEPLISLIPDLLHIIWLLRLHFAIYHSHMPDEILEFVPRRRFDQRIVVFLLALYALLFIAFVWPTPYRYDHDGGHLVRLNRATQQITVLRAGRWVSARPATSEEIRQLESRYGLDIKARPPTHR